MRNPRSTRGIADGGAPSAFRSPADGSVECAERPFAVSPEGNQYLLPDEFASAGTRSVRASYAQGVMRSPTAESSLHETSPQNTQRFAVFPCITGCCAAAETKGERGIAFSGHSLFQDSFFFCTVQSIGKVPGAGRIYVETVVDRDSGVVFAKVYSAKNAMNAVDLLASRVTPFFEREGLTIREMHTRKTSEYCGLLLTHPYETFLATSHIQHLHMNEFREPSNDLCERFYQTLHEEFFLPALRKKFRFSLDELQKDLDAFVDSLNAAHMKQFAEHETKLTSARNFPVDL